MDEEMEDSTVMFTFTVIEIDADYEFDAPRYFEFSRTESPIEARQAEFWFQSAPSYPPSPFVTKMLLRKDILMENVTTSPKDKKLEIPEPENSVVDQEIYAMDMSNKEYDRIDGKICDDLKSCVQPFFFQTHCIPTGLTFYNHALDSKAKQSTTAKPFYPKTSTLMKPTASQLAKQNRSNQVMDYSNRFLKFGNKEKSLFDSSTLESQAAKRQKLEGGQLHKVADTNQQIHLVHKEPKRDGNTDRNPTHAKLRITIPREPDLKTAQRAQRIRPKFNSEQETSNAPTFKALPLNRKILNTPSMLCPKRSTPRIPEFQEFHLKTTERAMQHNSAVPSYSVHCSNTKVLHQPCTESTGECSNRDSIRPNVVPAPKLEGYEVAHKFKALPLNKKIFTSKGDLGVFRNSKRETTVPKEFNLHTERRAQHDPPTELFNKLTLTSKLQPNTGSLFNLPRPACSSAKSSKENRAGSFQQESKVNMVQENPPRFKINQIPSLGGVTKIGSLYCTNRSSGIR